METTDKIIIKKAHCFFEQSGTFKNEFKKLGIEAEDYDIQNEFGQTDNVCDLFKAIEDAYDNKPSLFDTIEEGQNGDLIMAFFPCIYFCAFSQINISWSSTNYRKMTYRERTDKILERSHNREYFFSLAVKMFLIAQERGIRLIMENPWSEPTFLKSNFIMSPTLIDNNRMLRGDYFVKPTAYWFVNFEPKKGFTYQYDKKQKVINKCKGAK